MQIFFDTGGGGDHFFLFHVQKFSTVYPVYTVNISDALWGREIGALYEPSRALHNLRGKQRKLSKFSKHERQDHEQDVDDVAGR